MTVVSLTENEDISKMWLRKDIGMPVKMETKSAEGDLLIEYKNYNLEKNQPICLNCLLMRRF